MLGGQVHELCSLASLASCGRLCCLRKGQRPRWANLAQSLSSRAICFRLSALCLQELPRCLFVLLGYEHLDGAHTVDGHRENALGLGLEENRDASSLKLGLDDLGGERP